MAERAHTPGPWYILGTFVAGAPDGPIAQLLPSGRPADLRLIAAAPELLAALEDVRDNAKADSLDMWGRVEAALAKARGEPTNG